METQQHLINSTMGVNGAPSTPSGEGVGVGHKMVSVTKERERERGGGYSLKPALKFDSMVVQ